MKPAKLFRAAATGLGVLLCACSGISRDNPVDPGSGGGRSLDAMEAQPPPLQILVAVPKALLSVVYRVEAVLSGPDMEPVTEQLSVSPLGPAVGSIGALQPGSDRTLTVTGYDLQDHPLFTGVQHGITIAVGETTAVHLHLELVAAPTSADSSAKPAAPAWSRTTAVAGREKDRVPSH